MTNKDRFLELVRAGLPVAAIQYRDSMSAMQGIDIALDQSGAKLGRWTQSQIVERAHDLVMWVTYHKMHDEHKPDWVEL